MRINTKKLRILLTIGILLFLIIGGINIANTHKGMENKSLNSFQPSGVQNAAEPVFMGGVLTANLTILAQNIFNGTPWTALLNGKSYNSLNSTINIIVNPGNYTINFKSNDRWGPAANVSLHPGKNVLYENFYRLENLSNIMEPFGWISSEVSIGNYTAMVGKGGMEVLNNNASLSKYNVIPEATIGGYLRFVGWNGTAFISAGNSLKTSGGLLLYSYNPVDNAVLNLGNYLPSALTKNGSGYRISSMSTGKNMVFISATNYTGSRINQYGILSLSNMSYCNLTNKFIALSTYNVSSLYGNENIIISIDSAWSILNVTTMKIRLINNYVGTIIPNMQTDSPVYDSFYLGYNGSAFFIANSTSVSSFNPATNTFNKVYNTGNGENISMLYVNKDNVLAGVYKNNSRFSLISIGNYSTNIPFFIKTNASIFMKGKIVGMSIIDNYTIFNGFMGNGSLDALYAFTDSNFTGIVFSEQGLPKGMEWRITIGTFCFKSTSSVIQICNLTSGYYSYFATSPAPFYATPYYGYFTYTIGTPFTCDIIYNIPFTFKANTPNKTFGLAYLKVQLSNGIITGRSPSGDLFNQSVGLEIGRYSYTATEIGAFTNVLKGSFNVSQNCTSLNLDFHETYNNITFKLLNS
ncbi:MAG: hypothetical protein ACYDDC_04980, partial [Thermoplasmataceae archaeon]